MSKHSLQTEIYLVFITIIFDKGFKVSGLFISLQVVVRNVPHVSGQSLSETIDHFFQTNHPDHYLCHQVIELSLSSFLIEMISH